MIYRIKRKSKKTGGRLASDGDTLRSAQYLNSLYDQVFPSIFFFLCLDGSVIVQDDSVRIYYAQVVKNWFREQLILFTHGLGTKSPEPLGMFFKQSIV